HKLTKKTYKQIQIELSKRRIKHYMENFNRTEDDWKIRNISVEILQSIITFLKAHPDHQLKKIDLSYNGFIDSDLPLLLQLVEYCPQLLQIEFDYSSLSEESIKQIQAEPNKRWLKYYKASFDVSVTKADWSFKGLTGEVLQSLVTFLKEQPVNKLEK